jgi:hypothetical protein
MPASSKQSGSSGQKVRRRGWGFCSKSKSADGWCSSGSRFSAKQMVCTGEQDTVSANDIAVPAVRAVPVKLTGVAPKVGAAPKLPTMLIGVPPTGRGSKLQAREIVLPYGGLQFTAVVQTLSASEIGMPPPG